MPRIAGHNNENLKRLEREMGTQLHFFKHPHFVGKNALHIVGSIEQVENARRRMILTVTEERRR